MNVTRCYDVAMIAAMAAQSEPYAHVFRAVDTL